MGSYSSANEDQGINEQLLQVSDVSWLEMAHTHVGPKVGWMHVGHKGGKWRDIDLVNEARKPIYEYLQATRDPDRVYVFPSQRSVRLTEEGIHHWFRNLKARATKDQWEHIADLTFHDLRHDFAHRAREVGWSLEEVAYYLGHVTKIGTPRPWGEPLPSLAAFRKRCTCSTFLTTNTIADSFKRN